MGGDPVAKRGGGGGTWAQVRAVRKAVEAAEALARAGVGGPAGGFAPAARAGAGPAAGGAAGVGHAAEAGMAQAQQGPFTTFNNMLASHAEYTNLADDESLSAFLRVRAGVKTTQTEAFKDGPVDLTVLARALQMVLRLATAIMVGRHYGPNEELGLARFHSAFDGDALSLARTALADTPPSDGGRAAEGASVSVRTGASVVRRARMHNSPARRRRSIMLPASPRD